jgi:quinol monooxygenase YgiN
MQGRFYRMCSNMERNITIRGSIMIKQVLLAGMLLILATGAFAQEAKHEEKHGGKVTVIVTHEVKDYAAWRKVFDADGPNRAKGGFKVSGVYRDAKSPNVVSVVGEFPTAAAVEAFVTNPKLKEAMEQGGVLGKPDVKVLTKTGS